MNFPVDLTFKILALASQIYIRDGSGGTIGYVKQKLLKLKEDINVYVDESQTHLLYNIKADRMIDFSARYNFTDAQGRSIGAIKRQGMRSLWKARYDIFDAGGANVMTINEENGWIKVVDSLIGELPIVGIFTGYFFNPSYILSRSDGAAIGHLQKQPAFLEGKFQISAQGQMSPDEEILCLLSFLTMTLLERARG